MSTLRERLAAGARHREGAELLTTRPARFYVTHATRGNLFWGADACPLYFATRAAAARALADHLGDPSGYYVAELEDRYVY